MKSSVSRTFSAVPGVGAPSLNSSVPMLVWTLSGVTSPGGIAARDCALAGLVALPARTAAPTVRARIVLRTRWLMLLPPGSCLGSQRRPPFKVTGAVRSIGPWSHGRRGTCCWHGPSAAGPCGCRCRPPKGPGRERVPCRVVRPVGELGPTEQGLPDLLEEEGVTDHIAARGREDHLPVLSKQLS